MTEKEYELILENIRLEQEVEELKERITQLYRELGWIED